MSLIPSIVFAAWWNPLDWFGSNGAGNQQPVQQIVSHVNLATTSGQLSSTTEPLPPATNLNSVMNTAPVQKSSSSVNDEAQLKSQISSLTAQNNSLESKLATAQNQLVSAQNNYAMCQTNLAKAQSQNIQAQATQQPTTPPPAQTMVAAPIQQKTGTPNNNIPGIQPSTQDIPFQYNTYIQAAMSDYVKNPSIYQGWGTEILGSTVDDFIPVGNRGVTNNYIEITDGSNNMMIEIDNPSDYSTITSSMNVGDLIDVWGVGIPTQKFNPTSGSTSNNPIYEPVISGQEVGKCIKDRCQDSTLYVWAMTKSSN